MKKADYENETTQAIRLRSKQWPESHQIAKLVIAKHLSNAPTSPLKSSAPSHLGAEDHSGKDNWMRLKTSLVVSSCQYAATHQANNTLMPATLEHTFSGGN